MEFVTDRTYSDVQRALYFKNIENTYGWNYLDSEEKEEWLAGLKGSFNYTVLNRIEENTYHLDSYLMVDPSNKIEWQKISDTGYGIRDLSQNTTLILLDASVSATVVTSRGSINTINGPIRTLIEYNNVSYSVYLSGNINEAFLITNGNPVLSDNDIKINWADNDIPTETDFTRIINNINNLINQKAIVTLPYLNIDFSKIDFEFLNNIEQTQKNINEFVQGSENESKIPWNTDYIIDDNGNLTENLQGNHLLMTDFLRSQYYDLEVKAPKGTTVKAYFYFLVGNYMVFNKVEQYVSEGNRISIPRDVGHWIKIFVETDEDVDLENNVKVFVK